ncbi:MAG TPA: site-specific DNA-methyltransferase [Abditibacteriaceae bacterium]
MILGKWPLNSVHNTDCLQGLKGLPDDCIDIAVTSPPYWGQRGDVGIGSEEDPRDYIANLTNILLELMRTLKPTGVLWLNIADSYNTPINWKEEDHKYSSLGINGNGLNPSNSAYTKNRGNRRAFVSQDARWLQYGNLLGLPYRIVLNLCHFGMYFRGEIIWTKKKAMPEGRCRRPHRKHESIYIIAKSEKHSFRTLPPVSSVWELRPDANRTPHTSTFPLDLPLSCIKASGVEGGIVLDPFMGSGTTGVAAGMLNFDYIGFEINRENACIAQNRIGVAKSTHQNCLLSIDEI